jgi:predicted HNH restriction endonuclease
MKNIFENWLLENGRPKRYARTIITISNDLKKINYEHFDLYSINSPEIAKKIKEDYFNIDTYLEKNTRGNNMYSSAFDRYIEFLSDISLKKDDIVYPDEINNQENTLISEGAKKQVVVNLYERDAKARKQCLEKYGYNCVVCGFNFEKVYGEIGKNFIHVHHIKPLSEINEEYKVNPIQDLRPVCPNCHAMIHKRKPAYSIEEIKNLLAKDDL